MNIFVAHSSNFSFKEDLYLPIQNSDIFKKHDFILPQENGAPETTELLIRNIDLLIAEVSVPSTGMGIELGWAKAYNRPILCVYKKGFAPTSSLSLVVTQVHEYTNSQMLLEIIEKQIHKAQS